MRLNNLPILRRKKNNLQQFLDERNPENGFGYGDPDAKLTDDRIFQVLLAEQGSKNASKLNWITLGILMVAMLNLTIFIMQVFFIKH